MSKSLINEGYHLPKYVIAYTLPLNDEEFEQLDQLCINYGKCKNMFHNELCGINNLTEVNHFRKIRNEIRKKGFNVTLVQKYHFLSRHWTFALQETCTDITSNWTMLANRLKRVIKRNENLTDTERHWLYFILKNKGMWQDILKFDTKLYLKLSNKSQKIYFKVADQLSDKQIKRLSSYLRRITRRYKFKPHEFKNKNREMEYDDCMYRFNDDTHITICSAVSRKTFRLTLTSPWHYRTTGNIQIILDRDKKRIEIHKLIDTHTSTRNWGTIPVGIDKGLYVPISSSSGKEYGRGFSKLSNKNADELTKKIAERNKHRDPITYQISGSKHYIKQRNRYDERLKAEINHAIIQFIKEEKPSVVVKEDLTWDKGRSSKFHQTYLSKNRNRISFWKNGYLNNRLEYYCQKNNIPFIDVNPAYTSQYCPYCGHKFDKRVGKHHEWAHCVNCGWMNANIAAAKNVLKRKDDPEISLYTPYKKVKKILDSRI